MCFAHWIYTMLTIKASVLFTAAALLVLSGCSGSSSSGSTDSVENIIASGASTAPIGKITVIARFGSCFHFVADGPRGLYVLEWFLGYEPVEGDVIIGNLSSYGFEDVYYPSVNRKGRVWVEEFWESIGSATEEIIDHCNLSG